MRRILITDDESSDSAYVDDVMREARNSEEKWEVTYYDTSEPDDEGWVTRTYGTTSATDGLYTEDIM